METSINRKPTVKLVGTNGNVFAIIGTVERALRKDNQPKRAEEWIEETKECHSYDDVLQLLFKYVEPT
jgi:hypothetical protein